ncbi:hypothetical protein [Streptomyces sp. NPDC001970]
MPVRVFWKCRRKGCRHTIVRDQRSHTATRRISQTRSKRYEVPYLLDASGQQHPAHWLAIPMEPSQRTVWEHNGLICPDHSAPLWGETLQAKYNAEKVCNGRCVNARRASCECSCNGERHGIGYM